MLTRRHPKPNKDRATNPPPEKPGNKGWLVSAEQQLLCQFKADSATVHAQWVAVRGYSLFHHVNQCRTPAGDDSAQRHRGVRKILKTSWRQCPQSVR